MNDIIKIDHLNKSFGNVQAVRNLSFCVKEGELFAFLGINGAGKSTTINIMCGQLQSVIFCGQFNTCPSVPLPTPAFALV